MQKKIVKEAFKGRWVVDARVPNLAEIAVGWAAPRGASNVSTSTPVLPLSRTVSRSPARTSSPSGSAASCAVRGRRTPTQISELITVSPGVPTVAAAAQYNAGNIVIYATCNGANYQKWDGFSAGTGREGFRSEWNTSLCLRYSESKNYLDVVACDGQWYQALVPYFT